jgi:HEAT repeat protein
MAPSPGIDEALVYLFLDVPGAGERLAGFGPDAFDRVMELWTARPANFPPRLAEIVAELKRASVDYWAHAIAVVAVANPARYVDQLGTPTTLDVIILATIEDPRVVGTLNRALDSGDWLIRYHAVRSLARRAEPEARAHIRRLVTDKDERIRSEARKALRRRPR